MGVVGGVDFAVKRFHAWHRAVKWSAGLQGAPRRMPLRDESDIPG